MIRAGVQITRLNVLWKIIHIPAHILARNPFLDPSRYDKSPRGGGPGQSPISTNPPLSVEATGASLTQPGKPGGPARLSKRGSRPRRGPKGTLIKCPRGYHWDKKTGRCLKNRKKY